MSLVKNFPYDALEVGQTANRLGYEIRPATAN